jgi:hypothetical protein
VFVAGSALAPSCTATGHRRSRAPLDAENAAVTRVDLEFDQRSAAAQQLDLVLPAAAVALEFDFDTCPG